MQLGLGSCFPSYRGARLGVFTRGSKGRGEPGWSPGSAFLRLHDLEFIHHLPFCFYAGKWRGVGRHHAGRLHCVRGLCELLRLQPLLSTLANPALELRCQVGSCCVE